MPPLDERWRLAIQEYDLLLHLAKHLLYRVLQTLLLVCVLSVGCGRGPEIPLDNRTLDIMTRTRIVEAQVVFGSVDYVTCTSDEEIETYRRLMSSLLPNSSHTEDALAEHEYEMFVLGGKDPCTILVKTIPDNRRQFQWGRFKYTGGDAMKFLDALGTLRKLRNV